MVSPESNVHEAGLPDDVRGHDRVLGVHEDSESGPDEAASAKARLTSATVTVPGRRR